MTEELGTPIARLEAQKVGLKQTKDGIVVSFSVHPQDGDVTALMQLGLYDVVILFISKPNNGA